MGLPIFCTTRDEVEADVLLTAGCSLVTSWTAPPGTVVLFSSTFPEGPERIQAAARVRDTGATGGW